MARLVTPEAAALRAVARDHPLRSHLGTLAHPGHPARAQLPGTPGWLAVIAMVGFSTIMGGILGWLRLRGGSVWPAALAHSTLNATATLFVVFVAENGRFDPLHANITGWSGWIIPAILLVVLVALGKFTPFTPKTADVTTEPSEHG